MSENWDEAERKFYTVVSCSRGDDYDSEIWQTPETWLEVDEDKVLWAYYPCKNRQSCARKFVNKNDPLGGKIWDRYEVRTLYFPEVHTSSYDRAAKLCKAIEDRPMTDEESREKSLKHAVQLFSGMDNWDDRNASQSELDESNDADYHPPEKSSQDGGISNKRKAHQSKKFHGKKFAGDADECPRRNTSGAMVVGMRKASTCGPISMPGLTTSSMTTSHLVNDDVTSPNRTSVVCSPASTSASIRVIPQTCSSVTSAKPADVTMRTCVQSQVTMSAADIVTILGRIEQKVDVCTNEITKVSADNVAIRRDLLILKSQIGSMSRQNTEAVHGSLNAAGTVSLDLPRKIRERLPLSKPEDFQEIESWLSDGEDEALALRRTQLKDFISRGAFGSLEREFVHNALLCVLTKKFASCSMSWAGVKRNKEFTLKTAKMWEVLNNVIVEKFPNFQKNMGVHFNNFHKDVGKAPKRDERAHDEQLEDIANVPDELLGINLE